ncbi:hypothetical protein Corgl_1174 [Coriobacterium glomerans PW2]|uniref:Uncharacterized protein n=1 Tax=Coriobacterium glomerans (strain ATCC 49209 / DSM 20642 / JCM 10262 / PW2) TaxID=700015 RepID=F2N897_CORGP|nr:hypothetical protein Corgl_1174 [Coriobacterium glomerans PW2]
MSPRQSPFAGGATNIPSTSMRQPGKGASPLGIFLEILQAVFYTLSIFRLAPKAARNYKRWRMELRGKR